MTKHTGRFGRLDFDEKAPAATPLEDPWPNMDEHGCLQEGDKHFQDGLYEPALNAYSRALRFNRDLEAAWVGQIRCLINLVEYPEAITWSNRALERFPKSADLLACKGLALVLSGDTAEGTEYLDGAVEMRSPSAWVWLARGESLLMNRLSAANAERCFLKALELEPNDWHLELRIGMAYNRMRMYAQARSHLLAAGRIERENPLVLYNLGLAQEALGDLRAANGLFQRALSLRRDFPEAKQALLRVQGTGPLSKLWRQFKPK